MYIMCLSKGLDAIEKAIEEGLLPNKTIGFIPTAGETYENPYFVEESRARLRKLDLTLVEIDVTNATKDELVKTMPSVDGIFVAGGNSFHLLQQLQEKELVPVIREMVRQRKPYFGESAGAVILYTTIEPIKTIDDPEDAPRIKDYDALNLIDFIPLPHVGREKYKAVFTKFLDENKDKHKIVQYRDDQAILVRDEGYEIIPSAIASIEN